MGLSPSPDRCAFLPFSAFQTPRVSPFSIFRTLVTAQDPGRPALVSPFTFNPMIFSVLHSKDAKIMRYV